MPKGRTRARRAYNKKRAQRSAFTSRNRRANTSKYRSRGASAPKSPKRATGYINRRSGEWRRATGDAIRRAGG